MLSRESMTALLGHEAGLEVIGQVENGDAAIRLARERQPDLIIMNIDVPHLDSADTACRLLKDLPGIRVVAVSSRTDRRSVWEMLDAGALGYITKFCEPQELVRAIHDVAHGQVHLSTDVTGGIVEQYVRGAPQKEDSSACALTGRERQVLQLLADGQSAKESARLLHLSPKTVEWHRARIMSRLGLQNTAELVKYAIGEGLTSPHVPQRNIPCWRRGTPRRDRPRSSRSAIATPLPNL